MRYGEPSELVQWATEEILAHPTHHILIASCNANEADVVWSRIRANLYSMSGWHFGRDEIRTSDGGRINIVRTDRACRGRGVDQVIACNRISHQMQNALLPCEVK